MPDRKIQAHFIQPMLLLRTEALPTGQSWVYELEIDGFRAEAIKSSGRVHLRSRNDKDFNGRYPSIVQALAACGTGRRPPNPGTIGCAFESGENPDRARPVRFRVPGVSDEARKAKTAGRSQAGSDGPSGDAVRVPA